jgi:hypothetical protein
MFADFFGAAKLQVALDQQPIQMLMEMVPRHGGASPRGSIHRGPFGVSTFLSVQMPKLSGTRPDLQVFEIFGAELRTFSETSATRRAADVSRERQSRRRFASISAARTATACSMQRSIAAPSIVRLVRSSAAKARTMCSRGRNSAAASTAQKVMLAAMQAGIG